MSERDGGIPLQGTRTSWSITARRGIVEVTVSIGNGAATWEWEATPSRLRELARSFTNIADRADAQMPKLERKVRWRIPVAATLYAIGLVALVAEVVHERDGSAIILMLAWYGGCTLLLDGLSALSRRWRR